MFPSYHGFGSWKVNAEEGHIYQAGSRAMRSKMGLRSEEMHTLAAHDWGQSMGTFSGVLHSYEQRKAHTGH
jgi:hypothetical protein